MRIVVAFGARGHRLLRQRGELLERPNAHLYATGGMRRVHLRGHPNILKRLLVHVCGFNLGLLMRLPCASAPCSVAAAAGAHSHSSYSVSVVCDSLFQFDQGAASGGKTAFCVAFVALSGLLARCTGAGPLAVRDDGSCCLLAWRPTAGTLPTAVSPDGHLPLDELNLTCANTYVARLYGDITFLTSPKDKEGEALY